jgi:hypothetical protein
MIDLVGLICVSNCKYQVLRNRNLEVHSWIEWLNRVIFKVFGSALRFSSVLDLDVLCLIWYVLHIKWFTPSCSSTWLIIAWVWLAESDWRTFWWSPLSMSEFIQVILVLKVIRYYHWWNSRKRTLRHFSLFFLTLIIFLKVLYTTRKNVLLRSHQLLNISNSSPHNGY